MKLLLPVLTLLAAPALAEIHEVRMYNRNDNGAMRYEPQFLRIAPGDSVRFIPEQPGHNAATIDGMLPEGAEPFHSKMNEDATIAFDVPGRYGIKCTPHFAMGMVMRIEVGDASPWDPPTDLPKRAQDRFDEILSEVAE